MKVLNLRRTASAHPRLPLGAAPGPAGGGGEMSMGENGLSEREAADAVYQAASALQRAISEAEGIGLRVTVEADRDDYSTKEGTFAATEVRVDVVQPLQRRIVPPDSGPPGG